MRARWAASSRSSPPDENRHEHDTDRRESPRYRSGRGARAPPGGKGQSEPGRAARAPIEIAERRDAERPEETVFHLWRHMDDELREVLGGRGVWLDSSLTLEETVDQALAGLED